MKKAKNILLFIGIIFNLGYIAMQLFKFIYHCLTVLPDNDTSNIEYFLISDSLPILMLIILIALPAILLILNLKNKSGRVLPIISAVSCGLFVFLTLFGMVTPVIPQYLIYSKLSVIDTYWTYIVSYIINGGIFQLVGFSAFTVGSIMSAIKPKAEK